MEKHSFILLNYSFEYLSNITTSTIFISEL